MLKRILASVLTITGLLLLTACAPQSQQEEFKEVAAFYREFVEESSTLQPQHIKAKYEEIKAEKLEDKYGDPAVLKEQIFLRFNTLNPELFNQLAVEYGTWAGVGSTYVRILGLSLATEGEAVKVDFPLDAVSKQYDATLDREVYSISMSKITATLPPPASLVMETPHDREGLGEVRIIKTGNSYQIVPTTNMFAETGLQDDLLKSLDVQETQ